MEPEFLSCSGSEPTQTRKKKIQTKGHICKRGGKGLNWTDYRELLRRLLIPSVVVLARPVGSGQ